MLPEKPDCALVRTALERTLLKIGHILSKAMLFPPPPPLTGPQ
jgi:hypothetical protein